MNGLTPPQPGGEAEKPAGAHGSQGMERNVERIGNRLAASALVLWGTSTLLRVLQLLTTTVLARLLDPADYGIVALATVVVQFMDTLTNIQVGSAITRTRDLSQAHLDTAFTLNLIRAVFAALALVALAHPISVIMHDGRLQNVLYVLAIPALAGGIHNPHFLLYARDLDFTRDSKRSALAAVLASVVGIVTALIFHSYWALVAASVVSGLTWTVFSYWGTPARIGLSLEKSREILSYGSWLVLIGALDFINYRFDYVLIGRWIGSSALGAYNIGQVLTTTATGDVVDSIGKALFPAYSMLAHDLERLRNGYRRIQSIMLALALPIGFGLSAVAANVVLVLVGPKWVMAIPVVAALAPVMALGSVVASIESLLLSMNKGRLLFVRTLLFLALRVVLMVTGFRMGGFMGVVDARVIYGALTITYTLALAATITQSRMLDPIIASWRSLVSVTVMYAAIKLMFQAPHPGMAFLLLTEMLAAKVLTGAVIYIGTHALLWLAVGRPDGAERSLLSQAGRVAAKFGRVKPA